MGDNLTYDKYRVKIPGIYYIHMISFYRNDHHKVKKWISLLSLWTRNLQNMFIQFSMPEV